MVWCEPGGWADVELQLLVDRSEVGSDGDDVSPAAVLDAVAKWAEGGAVDRVGDELRCGLAVDVHVGDREVEVDGEASGGAGEQLPKRRPTFEHDKFEDPAV